MKHIIGFTICLFLTASTVFGADLIQWQTDYHKALLLSKEQKRPLFVHFYGDDCPPCKAMETEIFVNAALTERLNREFVPVKIKVADQPALAQQMSVTAIPTDIILSSDGQMIHRRQGGIKPERFSQYLDFLASKLQPAGQPAAQNAPVAPVAAAVPTIPQAAQAPVAPPVVQNVPAIPAAVQVQYEPAAALLAASPVPAKQPPVDPFAFQQHAVQPQQIANPGNSTAQVSAQALIDPFTKQPVAGVPGEPAAILTEALPEKAENSIADLSNVAVPQPPVNLSEMATATVEVPLALEGYCPVILNAEEKWIPGNPAFYTMFRGHIFRFSSVEAMDKFMLNPMKYVPMAMGEDIVQMIDRNKHTYGSRKFGAWYKDRVFLFSTQESLNNFAAKPDFYTDIALKYETALKNVHGRY